MMHAFQAIFITFNCTLFYVSEHNEKEFADLLKLSSYGEDGKFLLPKRFSFIDSHGAL